MRRIDIAVRATTSAAVVSLGPVLAQVWWTPFSECATETALSMFITSAVIAGQCWHARGSRDALAARDDRDELLLRTIASVTRPAAPTRPPADGAPRLTVVR